MRCRRVSRSLFSQHAADYQALAGKAAAFQEQFVHNLTAGAGSYASIEATIASLLQSLKALPGEALSSIAMLELRALWGMTVTKYPLGRAVFQRSCRIAAPGSHSAITHVPGFYSSFVLYLRNRPAY